MRTDPKNPAANSLPQGISEEAVTKAIALSGYPLQGVVASKLQPDFEVVEEWGYLDRDTKEHRSLDLFAYKSIGERSKDDAAAPALLLLIECKRSNHPFVFFQSTVTHPIPRFPKVIGGPKGGVDLRSTRTQAMTFRPVAEVLKLAELPFIAGGPPRCTSFSKVIPRGKEAELSGADPFNGIVLPLVKAFDHANDIFSPTDRPQRIFPALTLMVCVVDAPMVLIEDPAKPDDTVLCPWVRVFRREATLDRSSLYRFYALDVVHSDYFKPYIDDHVTPFGNEFADRAQRFGPVIRGGGLVPDLDNWTLADLTPRQNG